MREDLLLSRIADLERATGTAKYTFYTYTEYYVEPYDYGEAGYNDHGWKRKITSKKTGLSREEADGMCENADGLYQMYQE